MKKFIISTDGASRGNPGPAASAFTIQTEDGVMWVQDAAYLGKTTNNVAEYMAVKLAFERLVSNFAQKLPSNIEVRTDSLLLANQLSGKYKVKNETLKQLYSDIKELEKKLGTVNYVFNPREQNQITDRLANITLDKHASSE